MLKTLVDIAHNIGRDLIKWREQGGCVGHWEGSQFKAAADQRSHEAWVNSLYAIAPEIPIISEEEKTFYASQRPEQYFLIDPIDGTASYVNGYSGFVTQIALIERGQVKLAVVYAPLLNLTWHAQLNGGAFQGVNRIRITKSSGRLLIIDNYPNPRGIALKLVNLLPISGYLESGSIGLKACRVADGTADLFVKDVLVRDWDIAPADLIVSEAGGYISDFLGHPFLYSESTKNNGVIVANDESIAKNVLLSINAGLNP